MARGSQPGRRRCHRSSHRTLGWGSIHIATGPGGCSRTSTACCHTLTRPRSLGQSRVRLVSGCSSTQPDGTASGMCLAPTLSLAMAMPGATGPASMVAAVGTKLRAQGYRRWAIRQSYHSYSLQSLPMGTARRPTISSSSSSSTGGRRLLRLLRTHSASGGGGASVTIRQGWWANHFGSSGRGCWMLDSLARRSRHSSSCMPSIMNGRSYSSG